MEGRLGAESGGTPGSAPPALQQRCSALSGRGPACPVLPGPVAVWGTAFPSPRGCWRTAGSSHGLCGCGPFVLDAAEPCLSLPRILLQLTVRGDPAPTAGTARPVG